MMMSEADVISDLEENSACDYDDDFENLFQV